MEDIGMYDSKKVAKNIKRLSKAPLGLSKLGVHLFEGAAVFVDHPDLETYFPPLQMMFALKEHNGGKIDSHWWFFEAFSAYLNPLYTFLIDVGTKPRRKAFYHIYRSFERNPQIAGACGQITTRNIANFNPIVAAQHFEYKIANILDKSMESICGFISVLPGAFSAYRYVALVGQPLRKYFHHIEHKESSSKMSPFEANMYLAEDRILCFELFAKKDCRWTLHYIKDSVAETDVPEDLISLLKQRRRWINGSLFASLYALTGFWRVWFQTEHSFFRKLIATFEFMYYMVALMISWVVIGCFYLSIFYVADIAFVSTTVEVIAVSVLGVIILFQFLAGLNQNRPDKYSLMYKCSSVAMGVLFVFVSIMTMISLVSNITLSYDVSFQSNWLLLTSIAISVGIYFFSAILYGELVSILLSFSQYWAMIPTFTVIFPIFSMCNVHDISWGTRNIEFVPVGEELNAQLQEQKRMLELEKESTRTKFLYFRRSVVLSWILCNSALILVFSMMKSQIPSTSFLFVIFCVVLFVNGSRAFGSLFYWLSKLFTRVEEKDQNRVDQMQHKNLRHVLINNGGSYKNSYRNLFEERSWCAHFWFVPFRVRTWVAITNTLLISGLVGIPSALWCIISAALSFFLLVFLFPIGPVMICAFAISWRFLANMEFEINSNDGQVARYFKIDSSTGSSASLHCPPVHVEYVPGAYFLWMRNLLTEGFTYRSLFYFFAIKPVVFGISWTLSIGMFAVSMFLVLQQIIRDRCMASSSFICSIYSSLFESDWAGLNPFREFLAGNYAFAVTVPIGLFFFLLSCHFVNWIDWKSRNIASSALGEDILSLQIKKRLKLKGKN
jgi:cellulose synthase/poly-beta-1,6-N-acetylglucosamine synthase-like glycosyltransferase